ncbi:DNA-processing protein DprA [Romboutsia sp.]|uniref:DNA-processing protein DprA n=1 Tax=Romboutsia sp. TaxID=1965302 RepID=UPI003F305B60
MEKEIYYIWLSKIKGIGPILSTKLIDYFSDVIYVYNSSKEELMKVDGIGEKTASIISNNKDLSESEKILSKCKSLNIQIITKDAMNYPSQLKKFHNSPLILYVRGNLKQFDSSVAIVGSRRCSHYGKDITVELAEALSSKKIPIISGMAKGIDSYAHTVALHNDNYTIAILGTGVDICYPSEHLTLMNKIIENGAILSQFEPGTTNIKQNFIKRNELIAILSDKIVVVEASKDSGSLFTARCGVQYKKEVYAVPGNINSSTSVGTNILIKEGIKPYLSVEDIVENSLKKCIMCYSKEGQTLDEIKSSLNIDEYKLFELEANGLIKQVGGLFFSSK